MTVALDFNVNKCRVSSGVDVSNSMSCNRKFHG
jgi:hypothetical protein